MTFQARGLYASSSKEPRRFRLGPWMFLGGVLVLILVVVTAVSVLGNVSVSQSAQEDRFEGADSFELANLTGGEVILRGGEGDDVLLERDLRGSPLSEPDEDITEREGSLGVEAQCGGISFFHSCSVDYDVTVPQGTQVKLETISGQITVDNLEGDLEVEATSGEVEVTEVTGDVDVSTVSGGIELADVTGSAVVDSTSGSIGASGEGDLLEASSTSGTVDLSGFTADEVRVSSTSGDTTIGSGFNTLEADTVSGSIEIDTDTTFDLMAVETTSGSVNARVPDEAYDISGESTSGSRDFGVDTSADADSRIEANTTSGSVRIDSR